METIFQMRKRHRRERLALVLTAIDKGGGIYGAAKLLGISRGGIYRDLRMAGIKPTEAMHEVGRNDTDERPPRSQ